MHGLPMPEDDRSRMTLAVHLVRADGTRVQLRSVVVTGPADYEELLRGPDYPPLCECRCPRCASGIPLRT